MSLLLPSKISATEGTTYSFQGQFRPFLITSSNWRQVIENNRKLVSVNLKSLRNNREFHKRDVFNNLNHILIIKFTFINL